MVRKNDERKINTHDAIFIITEIETQKKLNYKIKANFINVIITNKQMFAKGSFFILNVWN